MCFWNARDLIFGSICFETRDLHCDWTSRKPLTQHVIVKVIVAQLCLTLCGALDCSPPGPSVHRILQAGILEWVFSSPPGQLPDPGIEPGSFAAQAYSLPSEWSSNGNSSAYPIMTKNIGGTSVVVQWLRFCLPNAGDADSIPGQESRIPHFTQPKTPRNKSKTKALKVLKKKEYMKKY